MALAQAGGDSTVSLGLGAQSLSEFLSLSLLTLSPRPSRTLIAGRLKATMDVNTLQKTDNTGGSIVTNQIGQDYPEPSLVGDTGDREEYTQSTTSRSTAWWGRHTGGQCCGEGCSGDCGGPRRGSNSAWGQGRPPRVVLK